MLQSAYSLYANTGVSFILVVCVGVQFRHLHAVLQYGLKVNTSVSLDGLCYLGYRYRSVNFFKTQCQPEGLGRPASKVLCPFRIARCTQAQFDDDDDDDDNDDDDEVAKDEINVPIALDDDDDDVVLYSIITPCYCSMLGALGSVVSFEARCQWALLSVQIIRHYPAMSLHCAEVHLSFCKVHACFHIRVSVIHQTLTWTNKI